MQVVSRALGLFEKSLDDHLIGLRTERASIEGHPGWLGFLFEVSVVVLLKGSAADPSFALIFFNLLKTTPGEHGVWLAPERIAASIGLFVFQLHQQPTLLFSFCYASERVPTFHFLCVQPDIGMSIFKRLMLMAPSAQPTISELHRPLCANRNAGCALLDAFE